MLGWLVHARTHITHTPKLSHMQEAAVFEEDWKQRRCGMLDDPTRFRVWGLGFRVWGLGVGVHDRLAWISAVIAMD